MFLHQEGRPTWVKLSGCAEIFLREVLLQMSQMILLNQSTTQC